MDKGKGIGVAAPKQRCTDPHCPFHGQLKVHGMRVEATVVRAKMAKTALVEWTRYRTVPKFERTERARSRVKAHNPSCINAAEGDRVTIIQTRPLSKTKCFVIVSKHENP